jgi:hypothetical protein
VSAKEIVGDSGEETKTNKNKTRQMKLNLLIRVELEGKIDKNKKSKLYKRL